MCLLVGNSGFPGSTLFVVNPWGHVLPSSAPPPSGVNASILITSSGLFTEIVLGISISPPSKFKSPCVISSHKIFVPDETIDETINDLGLTLVGKFPLFKPLVKQLRKWASSTWSLKGFVKVNALVNGLFACSPSSALRILGKWLLMDSSR